MLSITIFMILSEHFWETRGDAKTAEIRLAFKTFIFLLFFSFSVNQKFVVQWKSYFPLFKYIYLNNWWNHGQLLFYRGSRYRGGPWAVESRLRMMKQPPNWKKNLNFSLRIHLSPKIPEKTILRSFIILSIIVFLTI